MDDLDHNVHTNDKKSKDKRNSSVERKSRRSKEETRTVFTPNPVQLQRLVLEKGGKADKGAGFGFSLSDGLYDCGVYISAVTSGGLAHRGGLRMYDRILQVRPMFCQ